MTLKSNWSAGQTFTATDANAVAAAVNSATTAIGAIALNPTVVKTAGFTASASDLAICDASSGAFTVTLPSAPADGTQLCIKKIDSTTNIVTVTRGGTDVFNKSGGSTSLQLKLSNQAFTLQYKSGIWYVISDDQSLTQLDSRFLQTSTVTTVGSALVTAATQRAARMALGPAVFDARDFGVIGDSGSTAHNNVANLLDAVDQLRLAGGGVLLLPAGVINTSEASLGTVTADSGRTYVNNGAIPLPANSIPMTIIGHGSSTTILKASPGFPRAFDCFCNEDSTTAASKTWRKITIRGVGVDRNNITGATIVPRVAVTGATTTTITGAWTTIAGLNAADFVNAEHVYAEFGNTGTTRQGNAGVNAYSCRIYNGAVQFLRMDGGTSALTVSPGDRFRGATNHHALLGIHNRYRSNTSASSLGASSNFRGVVIDQITVEDCEVFNLPVSTVSPGDPIYGPDVSFYGIALNGDESSSITNVLVRRVRVNGGNVGVMATGINGVSLDLAGNHSLVPWYDNVKVEQCWHDTNFDMADTLAANLPDWAAADSITYANKAAFPGIGDARRFYIDSATGKVWRWVSNGRPAFSVYLGSPSGGSFVLSFKGSTTTALAYNASGATVASALNALGKGTFTVSTGTGVYGITAPSDDLLTGTASLTGGSFGIVCSSWRNAAMPLGGAGANYFIGGQGRVGFASVTNSVGRRSVDIALEFDNCWHAVERDNVFEEYYGVGVGPSNFLIPAKTAAGPTTSTLTSGPTTGVGLSASDTSAVFSLAGVEDTYDPVTNPNGSQIVTFDPPVARAGLCRIGSELMWYEVAATAGDTFRKNPSKVTLWRGINGTTAATHPVAAKVTFLEYDNWWIRSSNTRMTCSESSKNLSNVAFSGGSSNNLPAPAWSIRDATVIVHRGTYRTLTDWATFVGGAGWRHDLDIQGCTFIQAGLSTPFSFNGAAISCSAPTTTSLKDVPCAAPRIYMRNNRVIVNGVVAGTWSGPITGAYYAVFRPWSGYYRLDLDVEADVSILNAVEVDMVRLSASGLVIASGSRLRLVPLNIGGADTTPSALYVGPDSAVTIQDLRVEVSTADQAAMTTPWSIDSSQLSKIIINSSVDNSDGTVTTY